MLLNVRLLTVEEYHRMAEAGIFHPEERVELIAGQLIKMSAKGRAHESAITRTIELLVSLTNQVQMMVRVQSPIVLNDHSEPEPDFTLVRVNPLYYADHHPTPADVYLVIEIADSSFSYDRETKAKLYAQSGIADYWVLDVNNRQLHVLREPGEEGYQSEVILTADESVSPLEFPAIAIAVSQMLAPQV
jgi:Uma2 family endonuclease